MLNLTNLHSLEIHRAGTQQDLPVRFGRSRTRSRVCTVKASRHDICRLWHKPTYAERVGSRHRLGSEGDRTISAPPPYPASHNTAAAAQRKDGTAGQPAQPSRTFIFARFPIERTTVAHHSLQENTTEPPFSMLTTRPS